LQNLSLEKLAKLLNGKILSNSNNPQIPFVVGRFRTSPPTCITFLNKSFVSEPALLTIFTKHDVRCVVVKSPNMLTLDKWKAADIAIVEVNSLSRDYRSLAMFYRDQFSIPFIQVIGSSGKTTTKEMIGAVLNEKFPTLISLKNMNSPSGVAKNLFRLTKTSRAAVLEAGMKASGIIRTATRLIKPDIGVITSIHSAHLTRLGSIQNIIAAKAEIFEYLSKDGSIIVNWDDPNCHRLPFHRYNGRLIRYGFSRQCDLWASDIQRQGFHTNFNVNSRDLQFPCTINIVGRYNVGNALAAVAVGQKMGMSPGEIAIGLKNFTPVDGRLKVYHRSDGSVIIDDTYNANPDSTRLLVDELIIMAREQPVVLVIGDMERPSPDIENYARSVHFKIGQQLAQGAFLHVMAIGLWASEYVRGAIQAGFPHNKISYYETVRAAETSFSFLLKPGSTVVLKSSTYTKIKNLTHKFLG
jgi:UDP-N-acetylmuramoyl-tripeptide--D-alanyl-D-alanine ligase